MRIDANYGSDTGMCLVNVYLETERECTMDTAEIWKELHGHFDLEGISMSDVVDCFLYQRDADGNWVSAGMLP